MRRGKGQNPAESSASRGGVTDEQIEKLPTAATAGRKLGRRPYSEYPVAAAVLAGSGEIYGGAGNVECANYTLTKHAEETAIIAAMVAGEMARSGRAFLRAVYLPVTPKGHRVMPCGGCRQFMWEFSDESTVVINQLPNGKHETRRLIDLLPEPFGPKDLGKSEKDNPL